jgi:hypothetical protein
MAFSYKVLGQSNPSATTNTTLYTVPAATQAVVSSITICNQSSTPATVRIAVRPSGATLSAQHYIVYDSTVSGNDLLTIAIGISLAATDVVTVYASTSTMSFSLFGSEIA